MRNLEKQQPPKGIIEYTSPKSFFRKEKQEEVKVIQLDRKHNFIKFYNGIVNIYNNIVFGKHEMIPNDIFIDEYGQRYAIHIGDNIFGYKIFNEDREEEKNKLYRKDYNENGTYKYLQLDVSHSIIERKNELLDDSIKELSSVELGYFGRIKILDEIAEINPAQFYFGLAVGGLIGGIITFLLLYFLLSL